MASTAPAAAAALATCLAACGTGSATRDLAPAPMLPGHPGVLAGYLGKSLPDSLALLPPPPEEASPAFRHDEAVSRASQRLRASPRYALARADADLRFPHAAGVFACALGVAVDAQRSPRIHRLLQRTMTDAGLATYRAKDHYDRVRPFVHYGEGTCSPGDEASLRTDGSYPSGHTAIGWTWALVLTEIAPERADAVLARGRAFGESRLVCNAHWYSDVIAGRDIAAATVARLHADAVFRADVDAARSEWRALQEQPDVLRRDCASEAAALSAAAAGP